MSSDLQSSPAGDSAILPEPMIEARLRRIRTRFVVLSILFAIVAIVGLWALKTKSFPSYPWHHGLPGLFTQVAGIGSIVGAAITVITVICTVTHALWTRIPLKKPKEVTVTIFNYLRRFIENAAWFRASFAVLAVSLVVFSIVLARIPPSEQARYTLKDKTTDISKPFGLVVSPNGSELYIADKEAKELIVFGTKPLALKQRVPLSDKPHRLAIDRDGTKLIVTFVESGSVEIIDAKNFRSLAKIPTGTKPYWVTIEPNGKKAYVSNEGEYLESADGRPFFTGKLTVIDLTSLKITNSIGGVNMPEGLDVAKRTGLLYVASQGGRGRDPVFVVDTRTDKVLTDQTIGDMAVGTTVAAKPDGTRVYVTRGNFKSPDSHKWWDFRKVPMTPLGVIDTTTFGRPRKLADIVLKMSGGAVVVTPGERRVLVGNGNEIAIIDTTTNAIINTVKLSSWPDGIAVGADDWVYVTLPEEGVLFAFSLKGRS